MSTLSGSTDSAEEFRPTAPLKHLKVRAELLARVRAFFGERGILEVETPVLCSAGAVDLHLEPIPAAVRLSELAEGRRRYLVTSPEHSMKRLLAAGSGPIYQITRAFRDGERGRLHNPEFTILEWYRPGFDHLMLMDEVEELFTRLLPDPERGPEPGRSRRRFARRTYREAFRNALGIDPFETPVTELETLARRGESPSSRHDADRISRARDAAAGFGPDEERDAWLNVLLAERVEPTLGVERPTFLFDYPASQAALARARPGHPPVAERFELYVHGVELANGYHELLDAGEQANRFLAANAARRAAGKSELPLDERFLAAMHAGLPPCAGVAVGFDRVVMVAVGAGSIDEVITFPVERA